jgi:hypothetical protein
MQKLQASEFELFMDNAEKRNILQSYMDYDQFRIGLSIRELTTGSHSVELPSSIGSYPGRKSDFYHFASLRPGVLAFCCTLHFYAH